MSLSRRLATFVSRLKLRWRAELCDSPLVEGRIWIHGPGTLRIGNRVRLNASSSPIELYVGPGAEIVLGDDVEIQGGASIEALQSVRIGDGCRIGARCKVIDNHFHQLSSHQQTPPSASVIIEAGTSIESDAIILPGASVPPGSVIARGAVVRGRSGAGATGARQPEKADVSALPPGRRRPLRFLKRLRTDPLGTLNFVVAIVRGAILLRQCQRGAGVYAFGYVRIRNQGAIRLGRRVGFRRGMIPTQLVCHAGAEIRIGDSTYFNYGASIEARKAVVVGKRCLIASMVSLGDTQEGVSAPIIVGDDVWIAHGAVIAPGVSVGAGSVISAGSVVTKDVPPGSLAMGKPARCMRLSLFAADA